MSPNFSFVDIILFCYYFSFPLTIISGVVFSYFVEFHHSKLLLVVSIIVFVAAGYILAKFSFNTLFHRYREESNLVLSKKLLQIGWVVVFLLSGIPRLSVYFFVNDLDMLYLVFFVTFPVIICFYMTFCGDQKDFCYIKYSEMDIITIWAVLFANSVLLIIQLHRETRWIVFFFQLFFSPINFCSSLEFIQVYSGRLRITKERQQSSEVEEDQHTLQHL